MLAELPERSPERLPNTVPEHPRTPARTPPHTHSYTTYRFGAALGAGAPNCRSKNRRSAAWHWS